jgi:nicotinate-nucleotide pyrophosphorylase (carboxylating)
MTDPNSLSLPDFYQHLAATGLVRRVLDLARDEDLGRDGDITSEALAPSERPMRAAIVLREPGVVAGLATLPEIMSTFAPRARLEPLARDGDAIAQPGTPIARVIGPERELLAFERTALNVLGRLCGIATHTARFVAAIGAGTRAHLYDTRKTTPGMRVLEKYAVRCGGGRSHRLGLHDAVLIKDNHIAGVGLNELADVVRQAATAARKRHPRLLFVEVEVDSLEQLDRLLELPRGVTDIILLDNMGVEEMRDAVRRRDRSNARPLLEASGGVRLETVREIALTGVERISAGALTHGAICLDVGMDVETR